MRRHQYGTCKAFNYHSIRKRNELFSNYPQWGSRLAIVKHTKKKKKFKLAASGDCKMLRRFDNTAWRGKNKWWCPCIKVLFGELLAKQVQDNDVGHVSPAQRLISEQWRQNRQPFPAHRGWWLVQRYSSLLKHPVQRKEDQPGDLAKAEAVTYRNERAKCFQCSMNQMRTSGAALS